MKIIRAGGTFRFKKGELQKLTEASKRLDTFSQHYSPWNSMRKVPKWKKHLKKYEPTIGLHGEGI